MIHADAHRYFPSTRWRCFTVPRRHLESTRSQAYGIQIHQQGQLGEPGDVQKAHVAQGIAGLTSWGTLWPKNCGHLWTRIFIHGTRFHKIIWLYLFDLKLFDLMFDQKQTAKRTWYCIPRVSFGESSAKSRCFLSRAFRFSDVFSMHPSGPPNLKRRRSAWPLPHWSPALASRPWWTHWWSSDRGVAVVHWRKGSAGARAPVGPEPQWPFETGKLCIYAGYSVAV